MSDSLDFSWNDRGFLTTQVQPTGNLWDAVLSPPNNPDQTLPITGEPSSSGGVWLTGSPPATVDSPPNVHDPPAEQSPVSRSKFYL